MEWDQSEPHFQALLDLMDVVPIFPNPVQLVAFGKKISVSYFLRTAALSLGFHQPLITVVKQPTWAVVSQITKGTRHTVLKREFSGSSQHVIRKGMKLQKKDWDRMLESSKVWEKLKGFGIPGWHEQPFIPELKYLGEVRCLVVNGVIAYTVYTVMQKNGDWMATSLPKIRPLKHVK